jgi:autotransporter-associated beta strand protein
MNKTSQSPRFIKTWPAILFAAYLVVSPVFATDYFYFGKGEGARIDRADLYSTTDGSTSPATTEPGPGDNLFFYNSTVTTPANLTLYTGPGREGRTRAYNSMTFRANCGATQIDRSSYPDNDATVLAIGAGGISLESGAGPVTFGQPAKSKKEQRVVVGAAADLTITNNSSNDLTFQRVFDGRSENTMHTVTVAGSGSGNTVFVDGIKAGRNGRNLAMSINASGTGAVKFEGDNNYTGPTTVAAGKLFVNGDGSEATGPISVSADAALGGSGRIGGDVTIATNGRLEFNLGTSPKDHNSLTIAARRTLTFAGDSVLAITSPGGSSIGKYKLLTALGGMLGAPPKTLNLPKGWKGTVSIDGNHLVLHLTSVGTP